MIEATQDVELELLGQGYQYVLGIDEVGRGAIAGPVMVGVTVLTAECASAPPGLRDSKLLTATRREQLAPVAASWVWAWSLGEASAHEIDEHGIVECLNKAAQRALSDLLDRGIALSQAIAVLDGSHNWLEGVNPPPARVIARVKADQECSIVAAASIIAKVERDRRMTLAHASAPHFAWESNKGYGSQAHRDALAIHGPHELHRRSWIRQPDQAQ